VSSAERNLVTASLPAASRRALLKSKELEKLEMSEVLRVAGELAANFFNTHRNAECRRKNAECKFEKKLKNNLVQKKTSFLKIIPIFFFFIQYFLALLFVISGELSGEDRDRTLAWLQPDAAAALLKQGPEVY
jgi:hypothetical protein